ncbi:hypothetical protein A1O3_05164 [Capronia epimyces CBS 606.96]|uniref:BRCT domain-containing protein n=1 Tax=Capronia epimyces CBS 606.96 TaxID=1182542 RepID=W9Y4D1_9EURO|nr:uncharacterized protein A1O3_05164 [Capronia epimyces CBS 606.96]EXJ84495.1 hypothetical protein A1O3_05164 [Capronia epimyces CBS 606.96]
MQMGAQHKLDLTSDTTHLIVGSTDTLKYQYVAREREDIMVLCPEWVEAVREYWMNDLPLDLDALTRQYRMPTLAGSKICITGFEDISFRAQLQRNVVENGGEYTGDLTKDVTHLIAAKPEGKKYEYGMQWQKKVVSLKWYKDSLERGMQLDERLYHPTIPVGEQGFGAWNRRAQHSPHLGKRARGDTVAPEPSRKLRRTASAKLGGQNQDLWTDIVAGAGFEAKPAERPQLKPSVSMPTIKRGANLVKASSTEDPRSLNDSVPSEASHVIPGFLSGRSFIVKAFDGKKEGLLRKILVENGALIADEENDQNATLAANTFLLLPHDLGKNRSIAPELSQNNHQAVSELWLERCMLQKSFIPPHTYPLGLLVKGPCLNGFSELTVNATGFNALETLHISKMIAMLGGRYLEVFTSAVAVLVCKNGKINEAKLDLAHHSGIPCVSEEWLWSTIKNGSKAQLERYLIQQDSANATSPNRKRRAPKEYVEVSTIPIRPESRDQRSRELSRASRNGTKSIRNGPTPAVEVHEEVMDDVPQQAHEQSFDPSRAGDSPEDSGTEAGSCVQEALPLQELSNSSGRIGGALQAKKASILSLDGNCSMQESKCEETTDGAALGGAEDVSKVTNIHAINGAIREILEHQTKKNPKMGSIKSSNGEPNQKGRLIGRALSNLSNSSVTSNIRNSRASSVDSINTEGVGSDLVNTHTAHSTGETTSERGNFSFTGRAKCTLTGSKVQCMGIDDFDLLRGDHHGDEAPPMTQLGYEDPEEAILLRQKLAESRRKRSKAGNDEDEPNPVAARPKMERKLRDDVLITSAGWGAGRRTRQKQRSPQG